MKDQVHVCHFTIKRNCLLCITANYAHGFFFNPDSDLMRPEFLKPLRLIVLELASSYLSPQLCIFELVHSYYKSQLVDQGINSRVSHRDFTWISHLKFACQSC